MALLDIKNVDRTFVNGSVRTEVLHNISLSIEKGEFVSIVGPSGSGKSTLLNIVGCLDKPSSGEYYVAGTEVSKLSENELADLRNKEIGFVFQSFHLLKDLTAMANVELPLIYRGVDAKERKRAAKEALEKVGLGHRLEHYPKQMSGGEQQRVAIARAIVGNPSLILADEPTGALDSKTSVTVMELFTKLNQEDNLTIVQVTHDEAVSYFGNRTVHIFDGRIAEIEEITPEQKAKAVETMLSRSKRYEDKMKKSEENLKNIDKEKEDKED